MNSQSRFATIAFFFVGFLQLQSDHLFGQEGEFTHVRITDSIPSLTIDCGLEEDEMVISKFPGNLAFYPPGRVSPTVTFFDVAPRSAFSVSEFGAGVGIANPQQTLHVFSSDSSEIEGYPEARILVENNKSEPALRTMFELVNNGPARFSLGNTNSGQTWAFQTNNSDGFLINRLGSGGNEFSIRKNGMVTMGPGGVRNFTLHPNGDLDILGTLSELSDEGAKEQFQEVDKQNILKKLVALPITTWSYKDDSSGVRHMGPMAQDFHAAFGLGKDERSIASVDTTGVTIAAIQALDEQTSANARKMCEELALLKDLNVLLMESNARLTESNRDMETRLAAIESAVSGGAFCPQ